MLTNAKNGTIESIENGRVKIRIDDAYLFWEQEAFHDVQVGDTMHIVALKHENLDQERNALAKNLLNSALHSKEDL